MQYAKAAIDEFHDKLVALHTDFPHTTHFRYFEPADTPAELEPHNSLLHPRMLDIVKIGVEYIMKFHIGLATMETIIQPIFLPIDASICAKMCQGIRDSLYEFGKVDPARLKSLCDRDEKLAKAMQDCKGL